MLLVKYDSSKAANSDTTISQSQLFSNNGAKINLADTDNTSCYLKEVAPNTYWIIYT